MGRCSQLFVRTVLAVFIALTTAAPVVAEKRVALVIGNGAYKNAVHLPNPPNDATDVATALKRVGFDTILGLDLDRAGMDDHGVRFARAARDADIALFYYSGHAMQFAGINYLMPIDASLTDEADLRRLAKVDDIVADLQQAKNLRILVLDSCRDNPLAEELKRSIGGTRAMGITRGLAKIDPPQGMIVAYSTQSGRTAEDGTGHNSPYTAAFLKYIEMREEIGTVFRRISADVYNATQHTQLPELSLSLIGEFYLKGPPQSQVAEPLSNSAPSVESAAAQAWAATRDTTSVAVLEAFIQQYGDSIYAPFARARRDELRNTQVAIGRPSPPIGSADSAQKSAPPRLARDEVIRLFNPFAAVLERVRTDYVEPPDERKLLLGSIEAMRSAITATQKVSSVGPISMQAAPTIDLNSLYDAALEVLNGLPNGDDDARLVQAAIKGMISALDPHSNYMDAQSFRDAQVQTRGEFGGLGIEVTMDNGLIKVVAPIDDTPAAKAGILAGDIITNLDDSPLQGATLNDAVVKMRGPVGSKVKLTIARKGRDGPIEISITRDIVRVHTVRARIEGGDVGYIRITQFNEQTFESLKKAIDDITAQVGNVTVQAGDVTAQAGNVSAQVDNSTSQANAAFQESLKKAIADMQANPATAQQRLNKAIDNLAAQVNRTTQGDNKKGQAGAQGGGPTVVTAQWGAARMKGYIVDLRNTPGGLLDQAVAVSDAFLSEGVIVSTRGRAPGSTQRFTAKPGDITQDKPLIVLINGGTTAAAEVVAGALQDNKRATIVGTRSFGKGSVQTIIPLGSDVGALRLTTARFYTPSGHSIQANGIEPDLTVLQDVPEDLKEKATSGGEASLPGHLPGQGSEQGGSQVYIPPAPKDDKALQRAIELLHSSKR